MCEREMDGALFKTLLESGCRSLKANVRRLNDLNVFPIPDGDTGDNMLKTLYGGFLAIKDAEGPLGALAENAARGTAFGGHGGRQGQRAREGNFPPAERERAAFYRQRGGEKRAERRS